jgi:TM2 domain-containing membrane protein YozV
LALIGGSIGLHYFYANKVGAAVLTIILVMITCGVWAIIPVIQGIIALWTMTNEEFDRKFIATNSFFPMF